MRQVDYVKYNKLRREEFQIRTSIVRVDGRRLVEKSPVRVSGAAHIEKFPAHAAAIDSCFLHVKALPPVMNGSTMTYEYLEGRTLDEVLFEELRKSETLILDLQKALDRIFAVKEGALVPFRRTEAFAEVFGESYKGGDDSFTASNIDMIFENIIVEGEALICLDYEWVMDFPVPASFIKYRNLYYFYEKYKTFLSARYRFLEFMEAFGISASMVDCFQDMELHFQYYVHGENNCYAYTNNYVKPSRPFGNTVAAGRNIDQVIALKDNHIKNLEDIIASQQATLKKYQAFKKLFFGGAGISKAAKKVHPLKSLKLLAGVKHGNPFCGDSVLDRMYLEYGKLVFPVTDAPKVSIIIPAYNQVEYTFRCLSSVLAHTGEIPYEVIVADDWSTDGTRELARYAENIHVVRGQENLGFLKNCNYAAKKARGEYLFFLNNDTEVTAGYLSALVELMESDESIGLTGSKLVYPDGRLQEAGGIIWQDGTGYNYGRLDDPGKPEYNFVREVDYISGAAILISARLWREIGGFDEAFAPAYYEDTDLAFAVRKKGYRVVVQPKSVIIHYEGISNGTDVSVGMKQYQVINQETFRKKWKEELKKQYAYNLENPPLFAARERLGQKKIILVIDRTTPEVDRDAGSKSTFSHIQLFLAHGCQVKLLPADYEKKEPYTELFQQMGVEMLCGDWYRSHWQEWMLANKQWIYAVYINRPHIAFTYLDFIRDNTNCRILFYGHDLHFLREMREYEITGDVEHKRESEYMKKKELEIIRKANMSYYPSCVERDVLKAIDETLRVKAIGLYCYDRFREDIHFGFGEREGLLFVGGFAHRPNADAVLWFAKEIYPRIRKKLTVPFYVAGSKAPEEILALDGGGIVIKGFVSEEELQALYERVRMVVVPLRFGAGVKGKVLEAMYNGLPVITTSVGAEGIENVEEALFIEEDAKAFAERILEVYEDTETLTEISHRTQTYMKSHFGMEAVWEAVKEDL